MTLSQQQIDELHRQLVGWLCSIPTPSSSIAAEQRLRTQMHPTVYQTMQHLNELLQQGGPRYVRRVAERLGYARVADFFSVHPPAQELIQEYQQGNGAPSALALSNAFSQLAVLASGFNEEILHRLIASMLAVSAHEKLHQRFEQHHPITPLHETQFQKEWNDLQRISEQEHPGVEAQPLHSEPVDPVFVSVTTSAGQQQLMRMPSTVELYDPFTRQHRVAIQDPVYAQSYPVDTHVVIPRDRAANGITVECSVQHEQGWWSAPHRWFLSPQMIEALASRGTAVSTKIGIHEGIRLYPEYFDYDSGMPIPNEAIASLRVTPQGIDISRLLPAVQLTVLV